MIPLARAMRDAFASADPQVARHLASLPERPSCRKGCAACCELLNLITWPEAALIAEELRKHGWVARFLPALLEQAQASSFDGLDQASYWQSRIPCAFLRADRSCAIYDARPGPADTTSPSHRPSSARSGPRARCASSTRCRSSPRSSARCCGLR